MAEDLRKLKDVASPIFSQRKKMEVDAESIRSWMAEQRPIFARRSSVNIPRLSLYVRFDQTFEVELGCGDTPKILYSGPDLDAAVTAYNEEA